MALPTNTYTTYDQKGLREDLSNIIYDISPDETPLLSGIARVKATNTIHGWQTDTLRAAAVNAHLEGDDTTAQAQVATVRLQGASQIFKNAVITTGTDTAVNAAGRGKAMAYAILRVAKEQKMDIEKALFSNVATNAGANGTIRTLGGLPAWAKTNVVNVGAGGANPTGDGSDVRSAGALSVFNQTKFDSAMQKVWVSGGKPDCVYLNAFQMSKALGFTGNNNQRSTGATGKVSQLINVYMTPWGSVDFIPVRESIANQVWILEKDKLAFAELRPMASTELAKTGDNEMRQIISEGTLEVRNEKSMGLITDCTIT